MKKIYSSPKTIIVQLKHRKPLLISSVEVSGTTKSASSADAREFEFDDEEDW